MVVGESLGESRSLPGTQELVNQDPRLFEAGVFYGFDQRVLLLALKPGHAGKLDEGLLFLRSFY